MFVLLGLMKLHLTSISLSISWLIVLTQSWQVSLCPKRNLFCTALSVLLSPYQTQPLSQAFAPRLWCYIYREHKSSHRAISILSTQRSKVHSIRLWWQNLVPYTLLCCQTRWRGSRCPSALQKAAAMWWYTPGALFWLLLLRWSQAFYFFWLRTALCQMVSGSASAEYFSQIITHQCMKNVRVWLFSFVNTSVQDGDSRWRPLIFPSLSKIIECHKQQICITYIGCKAKCAEALNQHVSNMIYSVPVTLRPLSRCHLLPSLQAVHTI